MSSLLPRRSGLSNRQQVSPLLKTIGGRSAPPPDPQPVNPEPAEDAPPLSDSDGEFPSISSRGAIRGSVFMTQAATNPTAPKPAVPKTTKQKKKDLKKPIRTRRSGRPERNSKPPEDLGELELESPEPVTHPEDPNLKQEDDDCSEKQKSRSTGAKRKASDEDDDPLGGHHASAPRRAKTLTTFSKTSRFRANGSEEKPPRKVKREKKQARSTKSPSISPKRGLKLFDGFDNLDDEGCSSPPRELKDDLKDAYDKDLSSDDKTPKRKRLEDRFSGFHETQTEDSPVKRGLKQFSRLVSDTSGFDGEVPGKFSQLPSRPRSASSTSPVGLRTWSPAALLSPSASRPVCPMCNEEVERSLLDEFRKRHPSSTWRQQQVFCTQHKKAKAMAVWKERKYPSVDWKALDARISRQSGFLRRVLNGGKSHFRDVFAEKVKEAGRDRTARRAEEYLVPGYYGGRGLRAMSDKIVENLSSALRERSVDDSLVSAARGVGAYVQSVLVPELAVRLIMDDMDVGAVEARRIMEESMWVGELLNDELDDVVVCDDDEEEERHDDSALPGDDSHDSESDPSSMSDVEIL